MDNNTLELVSFSDVSSLYPANQPVTVKYQLGSRVHTSPFDWIGIFPDQWEDVSEPLAQISLPYDERSQRKVRRKSVTFSAAAIKALANKESGFQLVYVNGSQHILGVSSTFKLFSDTAWTPSSAERDGEVDRLSECSESPVFLSSASEDEEDWDTSRHSNTLREVCPRNLTVPGKPEGSSTSDLSDIVVLSTSPSQEAARMEEQPENPGEARLAEILGKIWSLGGSRADYGTAQVNSVEIGRQWGNDQEKNDNIGSTRDKNMKIPFSHSEDQPLVKQVAKTNEGTDQESGILAIEDISVTVEAPATSFSLAEGISKDNYILNQLKVIEQDPSSSEEDTEEREMTKDKDVDKEAINERSCSKLITEITETEAKSLATTNTKEVKAKPITLVDIPNAIQETSSATTPNAASAKKALKKAKKKKRDKKVERERENSEEDEVRETKLPFRALPETLLSQTRILDNCYEDEVLSGWPVSESDETANVNRLAFDELSQVKTNMLKDQIKHARRKERSKVQTKPSREAAALSMAGDEGEVYQSCTTAVFVEEVKMDNPSKAKDSFKTPIKTPKPKRAKKSKSNRANQVQEEDGKESKPAVQSASEKELKAIPSDMSGNKSQTGTLVNLPPERYTSSSVKPSDDCEPHEEGTTPKRKCRQSMKVKTSKKTKRAASNKRRKASQLSCEFQYLFSVDVSVSEPFLH
ncbi:hypothetical protein ElyMa_004933100 [Elysia marginata]|uniref:SKICH domain-containing protein n=1 Tax=Elysia marginata TaxID=1093978 RepID=A0AAV4IY45_9GAST|nr:hypothetical protein ElyMa_004933100 [Elysia marginata]